MPGHQFGEHLDASADPSGSRDAIGFSKREVNISLPNPARIYEYGLGAAVLHWAGEDVTDLLARYRRVRVPGSALAISHLTDEDLPEQMRKVEAILDETSVPVTYRPRAQASELFTGFDIVEPGAVYCSEWRSEPHETLAEPERTKIWAAGGIKT